MRRVRLRNLHRHRALVRCVALAVGFAALACSSHGTLLVDENGAEWIRRDFVPSVVARRTVRNVAFFRTSFTAPGDGATAVLSLRAFRRFRVFLNDSEIAASERSGVEAARVDLRPRLRSGDNTLVIEVSNPSGHPALLAHSDDLGLRSDADWEARGENGEWEPAVRAGEKRPFDIGAFFPTPRAAFASVWPLFAGLFAIGFVASQRRERISLPKLLRDPGRFRLVVMAAWTLLCVNNLTRIPIHVGFDAPFHYEYLRFIVAERSIPLADQGWQFFQSPGFYLLCLPFHWLFTALFSEATTLQLLRCVPMACGLVQIEAVHRSARLAFPGRTLLIGLATAIGAFLPMSVYLSQVFGNEPLAGCLSAVVVTLCLRLLVEPAGSTLARQSVVLGVVLGAALLSKVSAALLLPVALAVLVHRCLVAHPRSLRALGPAARFLGCTLAVAGWYYLRNWLRLGRPFVGGWDPTRRFDWWQDPSYRVPGDFFTFGEALVHPVYASIHGFWDGLYSSFWLDGYLSSMWTRATAPPWNYDAMLSLAPLSLPLCAFGLVGLVSGLWARPGDPLRRAVPFAAACIAIYWAALLYLFYSVPAYAAVKATYTLGLVPCYVLLIVSGMEWISRNRWGEAILTGYVCAWVGFSYAAFFVVR